MEQQPTEHPFGRAWCTYETSSGERLRVYNSTTDEPDLKITVGGKEYVIVPSLVDPDATYEVQVGDYFFRHLTAKEAFDTAHAIALQRRKRFPTATKEVGWKNIRKKLERRLSRKLVVFKREPEPEQ